MAAGLFSVGRGDPVGQLLSGCGPPVAGPGLAFSGGTDCPSSPLGGIVHRLLSPRVGSPVGFSLSLGPMAEGVRSPSHQLARTGGSVSSPEALSLSIQRKSCSCQNGQHFCRLLHQQARGNSFSFPIQASRGDSSVVPAGGHPPVSSVCSRSSQCSRGRPQPSRSSSPHGVDSRLRGSDPSVGQVVRTHGGPFRHKVQPSSTLVRGSDHERGSLGHRRSVDSVERTFRVCLPSLSAAGEGRTEGPRG